MKNYRLWREAAKAFKAFSEYDDVIYQTVGSTAWHSDPINGLYGQVRDSHMNTLLSIISEGKETEYWALHEKFDSPGHRTGKPVAWYKTEFNTKDQKNITTRKGQTGFIPEQLEKVFKLPERRGYMLALSMYNDLVKIEKQWRKKNEKAAASSKRRKR
jgi:hypothetical protein